MRARSRQQVGYDALLWGLGSGVPNILPTVRGLVPVQRLSFIPTILNVVFDAIYNNGYFYIRTNITY